jgi:hypothetical protein
MIRRSLRRAAVALGAAIAAAALFVVAAPSNASADALRPLNVSLACSDGQLPYGYSLNIGAGWYDPVAAGDATVVGNTKTFHFLIPTSAGEIAVNTWCGGYRTTTWQGYYYSISPGTSTVNASGYVNEYLYTQPYSGYQFWYTYCVLTSITYS